MNVIYPGLGIGRYVIDSGNDEDVVWVRTTSTRNVLGMKDRVTIRRSRG